MQTNPGIFSLASSRLAIPKNHLFSVRYIDPVEQARRPDLDSPSRPATLVPEPTKLRSI